MDKLLGHLAQFASLSSQSELLCTQALAYLLSHAEGEHTFIQFINSATSGSLSPGLYWHAESRQADGCRPDLEGRNASGSAVVKVEAKLGAPFGDRQLESYLTALNEEDLPGVLLILVPQARREETVSYVLQRLPVTGNSPWCMVREERAVTLGILTWEEVFEALSEVSADGFQDDLGQLHAMYRVFNGDDMEPLTSDEQVLQWRENEQWWVKLVDSATRRLTLTDKSLLPMTLEQEGHPYYRRYVCQRLSGVDSCYSVGTRDPFQDHQTPIWLRFHQKTGLYSEIVGNLEKSEFITQIVRSQGHLWLPLEVPRDSEREIMAAALVRQVQRIVNVAY